MPSKAINIEGSSEMDLLTRTMAIETIAKLPTDQLKRLKKLTESTKAIAYLSSESKFQVLKAFL